MPQFTYDPNNPGAMYINTATSGFSESGKPKEPEAFKSTTAAAAPGKTAAEKAADRKAARKKAAKEAEARKNHQMDILK